MLFVSFVWSRLPWHYGIYLSGASLFENVFQISRRCHIFYKVLDPSLTLIHVDTCLCVSLQRSRSAFSLTSDDSPEKGPEEEVAGASGSLQEYASLKREAKVTSLPSWKSVDRLDNSSKCPT